MSEIKLKEYTYEEIEIGFSDSFIRKITENDLEVFGKLTGDYNPIHYNSEYAESTRFKGCIIQGLLTASFISPLIGMLIPGKRALYLSQEMKFIKPVRVGDTLNIKGTVNGKNENKKTIDLLTEIVNQDNLTVLTGQAKILLRDNDFESG